MARLTIIAAPWPGSYPITTTDIADNAVTAAKTDATVADMADLTAHASTAAGVHGLGSGRYFLGCRYQNYRIEYRRGMITSGSFGWNTITVTWAIAFSTIWGCVATASCASGERLGEWSTFSFSTTGVSMVVSAGVGGYALYLDAIGIGS